MFQPCHPASSFPILSSSLPPQSSESTCSLDLDHSYLTHRAQLTCHTLRGASHRLISRALLYTGKVGCKRMTASVPPCLTTSPLPSSTAFTYDFVVSLTKEVKSISPPLQSSLALGLALAKRMKWKWRCAGTEPRPPGSIVYAHSSSCSPAFTGRKGPGWLAMRRLDRNGLPSVIQAKAIQISQPTGNPQPGIQVTESQPEEQPAWAQPTGLTYMTSMSYMDACFKAPCMGMALADNWELILMSFPS